MTTLFLIGGGCCGLCLVLTPLARGLAARYGLVDRPDGRRKIHPHPVPVAGGLAILLSTSTVLAVALLLPNPLSGNLSGQGHDLLGLFLAAVVICAVGVADDFGRLRGRHKLLGQVLAALVVVQFGLVVRTVRLFDWHLELGPLAVPFTVIWLLGAINSLNLIDGMDGLLTSVGLIISLALVGMAALTGKWAEACVAAALAGALAGFLRYNFPPASVFLGDSGSMLIGLVVGTLAIHGSLKAPATITLAAPTALLTIPFFDTAAAVLRRKLTGRSIYTTDRGHLHHCLLRRGLSNRRALLCVSFFCLIAVVGALASLALEQELIALLAAGTVVGVLIVTHLFGYAEYVLVKERLASVVLSFLRVRDDEPLLREVRLQGSVGWQELWGNLVLQAHRLDLKMVRLNVNAPALHEGYHAHWECAHDETEEFTLWHAEIPLTLRAQTLGQLEVFGVQDDEPVWKKIAALMNVVEKFATAAATLIEPAAPPVSLTCVNGQAAEEAGGHPAPV